MRIDRAWIGNSFLSSYIDGAIKGHIHNWIFKNPPTPVSCQEREFFLYNTHHLAPLLLNPASGIEFHQISGSSLLNMLPPLFVSRAHKMVAFSPNVLSISRVASCPQSLHPH